MPRLPRFRSAISGRMVLMSFSAFLVTAAAQPARADYITPGLGADYTLDDLVAQSGGAVTGADGQYQVNDSVVIAVNDALIIGPGSEIVFASVAAALRLEINGSLLVLGDQPESILFTSLNQNPGDWAGIDFRDTGPDSACELLYCSVEYAAIAIDVVYADATVDRCIIRYAGSKAVDLTGSGSTVTGCEIHHNEQQTIYMTLGSAPLIEGNHIHDNNLENSSPYPFINIGLQGVNSPTILSNTITGGNYMSGGIAIWNASNAIIEGNHIENCGYGILCYQFDANPWIRNNVLLNNNIHPDTLNWGFGIACNGQNAPIVTGNVIQGHWYGVATINGGQPNLGDLVNDDPDDDGGNMFLGNGLGGQLYELYNNTNLDLMAQNNWWGTTDPGEIEDRIVHSVDDLTLGTVIYDPWMLEPPLAAPNAGDVAEPLVVLHPAHPNPFNPVTTLSFELGRASRVELKIYDLAGRLVRVLLNAQLPEGIQRFRWDGKADDGRSLPSGVYYYRVVAAGVQKTGSMVMLK